MPTKTPKNVAEKVTKKLTKKVISKPPIRKSVKYWNKQPATIDGVLGGYGKVDQPDIKTSKAVLRRFKAKMVGTDYAVDMGAGIGRISMHLLLKEFKKVDLVEPAEV